MKLLLLLLFILPSCASSPKPKQVHHGRHHKKHLKSKTVSKPNPTPPPMWTQKYEQIVP